MSADLFREYLSTKVSSKMMSINVIILEEEYAAWDLLCDARDTMHSISIIYGPACTDWIDEYLRQ